MVVGFNLDDVLRNTSERILGYFLKEYPNSNLKLEDVNIGNLKSLPFQTKEKDRELLSTDQVIEQFFQDYVMEIFGSSRDQYPNSNKDFNRLVSFLDENSHKTIIVQKENGKIKNSSLYFICDRFLDINDVTFTNKIESMWDKCDTLVAANPKIIDYAIKNNKNVIKVERWYNQDLKTEFSIKEIKDIFNLEYFLI